jgi:hypothetical protein
LSYEASQTTEIPQTTTEKPIESNFTENEGVTEIKNNKLEELSENLTQGLEQVSQDNKLAIEGVEVKLLNITSELKNSVENMPKVFEKAVEKLLKESLAGIKTCTAVSPLETTNGESAQLFEARLENMKLKMENLEFKCAKKEEALKQELSGKKALATQLSELKQELALMVQEKLDAMEKRLTSGG